MPISLRRSLSSVPPRATPRVVALVVGLAVGGILLGEVPAWAQTPRPDIAETAKNAEKPKGEPPPKATSRRAGKKVPASTASPAARTCGEATSSRTMCAAELIKRARVEKGAKYPCDAYGCCGAASHVRDKPTATMSISSRSEGCQAGGMLLDEGVGQRAFLSARQVSCDGSYRFRAVGRILEQLQRSLELHVYFGDPADPQTPSVFVTRWVWNGAREAGVNTGGNYEGRQDNFRLDWWNMPSSEEWVELDLRVDAVRDTCTAKVTSDTHTRVKTFACVVPADRVPTVLLNATAPCWDKAGPTRSEFISLEAWPDVFGAK